MRMKFAGVLVALLVIGSPAVGAARDQCERLPRTALKTRACNPKAECLSAIPKNLPPDVRAAREKECSRQPAAGVCYGPDRYDPQADCKDTRRR